MNNCCHCDEEPNECKCCICFPCSQKLKSAKDYCEYCGDGFCCCDCLVEDLTHAEIRKRIKFKKKCLKDDRYQDFFKKLKADIKRLKK